MSKATPSATEPADFFQNTAGFYIVGNGPPESPIPGHNGLITVCFNGGNPEVDWAHQLLIRNGRVARTTRPFSVDIPSNPAIGRALEVVLEKHANTLTDMLGAFPSSGLCFTRFAFQHASLLRISRMPLRPSLRRRPDMPPRKPLASAFHNWLGERRFAFSLLSDDSGPDALWPGLILSRPTPSSLSGNHSLGNPYEALLKAFTIKDIHFWQRIAHTDALNWLHALNTERLINLEPFFHLDRHQAKTSNWWLYDNAISNSVDQIHEKLAWCQQSIFDVATPG